MYTFTGGETLTPSRICAGFEKMLESPVKYQEMSDEAAYLALLVKDDMITKSEAEYLLEMNKLAQQDGLLAISKDYEKTTGEHYTSFDQWLEKYKADVMAVKDAFIKERVGEIKVSQEE